MISRGLAKSWSRDQAPAVGALAIAVGSTALLIGGLLGGDRWYSSTQSPPGAEGRPGLAAQRPAPAVAAGAIELRGERRLRVRAERSASYARRRKGAWQRRARRAEQALKQLRMKQRRRTR